MKIYISEVIEAVGGALLQGFPGGFVKGVSTDSRKAGAGEVFFALRGPNFDGHKFIKDVFSKGAAGAVVERAEGLDIPPSFSVIAVGDTLKALGLLAGYIRGLHKIPVIAITGSAGKTTTKEMTAAILKRSRNVLKTEGNLNNLIGLPLTLFGLDENHQAAVVELGISEMWEMDRLFDICRPGIALITNIGRGHLKTLGSLEGVAKAKGPLFTRLGPSGVRVVNLDDPWAVKLAGDAANKVTYSAWKEADVRVKGFKAADGLSGTDVIYDIRGRDLPVRINSAGSTDVINGAAAIAATLPLGVSPGDIQEGLGSYRPVHGRMEVLKVNGLTILDDTYNANPESVAAALKTLKSAAGRKVAVLGDMLELGDAASAEHRAAGRLAGETGADIVVAVGSLSRDIVEGASSAGAKTGLFAFEDKKEALAALKELIKEGDSILVKGSRATALDEIVEGLKGFSPH